MTPEHYDLELGDNHWLQYVKRSDDTYWGAIIYHPLPAGKPDIYRSGFCEGVVAFKGPRSAPHKVTWDAQGEIGPSLTLSPSVLCVQCGDHGFIRSGKWVRV